MYNYIIKEAKTQDQKEWVSVEERLPEVNSWVLVTERFLCSGSVGVPRSAEFRSDGKWYFPDCIMEAESYYNIKITHWRLLPDLP